MIETDLIAPIGVLLARHASARPEQTAFEDRWRAVTYAALQARTARLAGHLQAAGVRPGDRVAVLLPNSVDWVEACLAIVRAGAIAVPISADATEAEAIYRLENSAAVACYTSPAHAARVSRHLRAPGLVVLSSGFGAGAAEQPAPEPPRDHPDIQVAAFIVYTSGTTGQPKGVMLSVHGMLWVTAACWHPIAGLHHGDWVLNGLPLYHSYALNLAVLAIVATGASEYIMEKFSTSETLALLKQRAFTVLPGVPTMFHYLLNAERDAGKRAGGTLRVCLSAGAILAGSLNRDFEAAFGIKLLDGYGITETSTMVTLNWPTGTRVMGSCGLPLPGLATRLIDPVTALDCAPGAEGELIVRGPTVMLGYHDNPASTASALRQGWYYTGDLARQDENGYLTITGRLKEIIIRGGQNIAPAEVEEVLIAHPAVADCAIVGMKDAMLGEVPVAFIVLLEGASLHTAALLDHCRASLSAFKVPAAFHVVTAIPRTGSGKTIRYKLAETLGTL